jgi:hypothetical protein
MPIQIGQLKIEKEEVEEDNDSVLWAVQHLQTRNIKEHKNRTTD